MKIRSNVKAGSKTGNARNHNQTITRGVRVKSNVKAGIGPDGNNHNQTITRGVRVKTNMKAGIIAI
jgi:hypothetical protein